ncbi:MAG: LysR family transcriptional regulator [Burkholderiales bacterium]|nr:LysR family transcriptional regulator [Burkholderiales bacterium]
MDLRRIRHFVVLAETLNFRRAAERLQMAQPPLSVSIRKLEAELGAKLFSREPGGVLLTPSGRAVLVNARKLLFHGHQLSETARSALDGTGGSLQIGFVGSATHGMLQRLIPVFRAEYPGVELLLREATSVSIIRQLEDRALDIGLVRVPPLRLSDMAQESFVMYAATHAAGLHSAALLACQQAGFIPRVSQQAVQVQTVLALVESGLGVALVPSVMQRYISDRIVYRSLLDVLPQAAAGLALAYMEETGSAAAARFRQLATREFALEKSAGSLAASERRPATQARTVQGLPQPFS